MMLDSDVMIDFLRGKDSALDALDDDTDKI